MDIDEIRLGIDDKTLGMEFLKMTHKEKLYRDNEYVKLRSSKERNVNAKGKHVEEQDKIKKISKYIEALERTHEIKNMSPEYVQVLKNLYFEKYVRSEADVESFNQYFAREKNRALDCNYPIPNYTEDEKIEEIVRLISIQHETLEKWVDFFVSSESSHIPMWCKYWLFQGMIETSKFEKENQRFNVLSAKQITERVLAYPDLNIEALNNLIDHLNEYIKLAKIKKLENLIVMCKNQEEINSLEIYKQKIKINTSKAMVLNKIGQGAKFAELYAHMIMIELVAGQEKGYSIEDGEWVNFEKESSPEIMIESINKFHTGWCITSKSQASKYLSEGNIWIYFTKNKEGIISLPRLTIRVVNDEIVEVAGVNSNQQVEDELLGVLENKLCEFANNREYMFKLEDMKRLKTLHIKHMNILKNKEKDISVGDFTVDELLFLYEIFFRVFGFGNPQYKHPRIIEILETRDSKQDIIFIMQNMLNGLQFSPEQISLSVDEIFGKDKVLHYGDIFIRNNNGNIFALSSNQKISSVLQEVISQCEEFLSNKPTTMVERVFKNLNIFKKNWTKSKQTKLHKNGLIVEANVDMNDTINKITKHTESIEVIKVKLQESTRELLYWDEITKERREAFEKVLTQQKSTVFHKRTLKKRNEYLIASQEMQDLLQQTVLLEENMLAQEEKMLFLMQRILELQKNAIRKEEIKEFEKVHQSLLERCSEIDALVTLGPTDANLHEYYKKIKEYMAIQLKLIKFAEKVEDEDFFERIKEQSVFANTVLVEDLILPRIIVGNLCFESFQHMEEVVLPILITGMLHLDNLTTTKNLIIPNGFTVNKGVLWNGEIISKEEFEALVKTESQRKK